MAAMPASPSMHRLVQQPQRIVQCTLHHCTASQNAESTKRSVGDLINTESKHGVLILMFLKGYTPHKVAGVVSTASGSVFSDCKCLSARTRMCCGRI